MKVKARTGKIWDQQFHSREDTTQIENNLEHMILKRALKIYGLKTLHCHQLQPNSEQNKHWRLWGWLPPLALQTEIQWKYV